MSISLFILLGCEKELYEDSIKTNNKNIKVSHISLKDLDKKISTKINEKISTIKKLRVGKNKNHNKFEYDSSLDLYIDFENGKLIDNNGELSYTFPMFRESEDNLENIIFKTLNSGEIETFLSKYNVTPEEFDDLSQEQIQNLNPTFEKIIYQDDNVIVDYNCVSIYAVETEYNSWELNEGNGNPSSSSTIEVFVAEFCHYTYTFSEGGGTNGNGSTSGSDSDISTSGSGGVTTSPTSLSPKELLKKDFIKQLTTGSGSQKECLDGLTDGNKREKILNFLGSYAESSLSECPDFSTNNEDLYNFIESIISSQCGPNAEEDWSDFENQFLIPSEGKDFLHNENYWNNPLLSFPQQDLPTYVNYYNGMPRDANGNFMIGADNVYGLVGGDVLNIRNQYPIQTNNTCALKVSIALIRSGITIPNIPGQTVEGGGVEFTGKYFFLNARSLNAWMRETFGTNPATSTTPLNNNHLSFEECDGGKNGILFGGLLNNKFGIYSMITKTSYTNNGGASGHADLLFPSSSGNTGTTIYGPSFNLPIERIDVWTLN